MAGPQRLFRLFLQFDDIFPPESIQQILSVKTGKIQRMAELDPDPFWTEQSKETESR